VLAHGSCVVGAGEDADLILEDETVSRRHVELKLVPEGVEVIDLGSRNGTFYLGQRVQHMVLAPGSKIRLGRVELDLEADNSALAAQLSSTNHYGSLRGGSEPMRHLYGLMERLTGSLVSVLIEGETGTGKELIAKTLHDQSMVKEGPFVAVNCGALDQALVRSELFGHVRGAFTGAVDARVGAFEAATNGTLFLDEIGELPLEVQPLLLRVLETRSVQRVGDSSTRKVNVRVITATHRNLEDLVREGRFREDLYYRLLVVRLTVPPLRHRPGDIPDLVRSFSDELQLPPLPEEVITQFVARSWTGNVRELKNAVLAYLALGTLPTAARSDAVLDAALRGAVDLSLPYAEQKDQLIDRFLRVYLDVLLKQAGQNQSEAARLSGIDRSHLNKLIRKLL
jgi:DNA-binding NtrC family response regulator